MRRFSLALVSIFAALLTVSCTKPSSDNNSEAVAPFSILTGDLVFDCAGGTKEFEFTAPGAWTLASQDESWCTVSPSSGSGDSKVSITVAEIPDTEEARSTKLILTCNGLTLIAGVTQSANPEAFVIEPSTIEIGPLETDFTVKVFSRTREFEVSIVDEWISEVSREGEPATWQTITFHASANTEVSENASARTGVVSICTTDDAGTCFPVMVRQGGCYDPQVLAMRFTATWCGYCPYMDEAFKKAEAQDPHFEYVTMHAGSSDLKFSGSAALEKVYKISGYPTGILAGWKEISNYASTDYTAQVVVENIADFIQKFPCAVKPSATATIEGGEVKVKASVTSSGPNSYYVAAVIMESGIVSTQTFYPNSGGSQKLSDYVHDNIARYTLTESLQGDAFEAKAYEPVEFSWSAPLDASWNADNLSVAVWVYADYGDLSSKKSNKKYPDTYIANSCVVPVE